MAPALTPAQEALLPLYTAYAVPATKATELVRNAKQAALFADVVGAAFPNDAAEGKAPAGWDEEKGKLLLVVVSQSPKLDVARRARLAAIVAEGKLGRSDQVLAAIKYVESNPEDFDSPAFDKACGVGVNIAAADIPELVEAALNEAKPSGWEDLGKMLGAVKNTDLKWAPALDVKTAVEASFISRFGTKEAARSASAAAKTKGKGGKDAKAASTAATASSSSKAASPESAEAVDASQTMFTEGWLSRLHKPGENPQIDPKLMEEHLKFTGGKVFTRFPPEPNGYLHIGHSKAIAVNFGYAKFHGGHTYLRYDDTNPSAEEGRYFESILEMVRWLGFEPWAITYSSDHFQRLYDLATELIRKDKAYMCYCTAEEQFQHRGGKESKARTACAHRSAPIEDSLREFARMRAGEYKKGEATLRMKMDLSSGNPQMWDLIAYRVVEAAHHRTGTDWPIYPTYDFTHCLVDSFENISHSLCTTEFIQARESYEWLCDALEVYKPRQSEYGRLNIQGSVMSKRKIKRLVDEHHVSGWDDPRMYTLIALRRRGVPPGAIVNFVQSLGVSTALSNIQLAKFESSIRTYLESSAPRLNFVLRPLKVTISNVPEGWRVVASKPYHPKHPEMGTYDVAFTKTFYIDHDDFRLEDSKDYFRLAPGKTVGLFSAPGAVTCEEVIKNANGEVAELIVKLDTEAKKPKAYIQWVAEDKETFSPIIVDETRIFNPLFKSDDPAALDDYLADINPESLVVVRGALIEPAFWALAKKLTLAARAVSEERTKQALAGAAAAGKTNMATSASDDTPKATAEQLVGPEDIRFQGLRVAYFAVDKDAKLACLDEPEGVATGRREGDVVVLNRIVSLKEDTSKKVA